MHLGGLDMTLTEKIQTALIGSDYLGSDGLERRLSDIIGQEMHWYATAIDDGADDDETEDQYVIRACFESENQDIIVRVYFGDVTKEIGYVDVSETAI